MNTGLPYLILLVLHLHKRWEAITAHVHLTLVLRRAALNKWCLVLVIVRWSHAFRWHTVAFSVGCLRVHAIAAEWVILNLRVVRWLMRVFFLDCILANDLGGERRVPVLLEQGLGRLWIVGEDERSCLLRSEARLAFWIVYDFLLKHYICYFCCFT